MGYGTDDARGLLLETLATAADRLGQGLACLGEAYEKVDDQSADRLEEELFQPVQTAYGRAKREYGEFAARHGLTPREFAQASAGAVSATAAALIAKALDYVDDADHTLSVLQDSMLPIEAGDPEFRAGLIAVREPVRDLRARARTFTRGLGR